MKDSFNIGFKGVINSISLAGRRSKSFDHLPATSRANESDDESELLINDEYDDSAPNKVVHAIGQHSDINKEIDSISSKASDLRSGYTIGISKA